MAATFGESASARGFGGGGFRGGGGGFGGFRGGGGFGGFRGGGGGFRGGGMGSRGSAMGGRGMGGRGMGNRGAGASRYGGRATRGGRMPTNRAGATRSSRYGNTRTNRTTRTTRTTNSSRTTRGTRQTNGYPKQTRDPKPNRQASTNPSSGCRGGKCTPGGDGKPPGGKPPEGKPPYGQKPPEGRPPGGRPPERHPPGGGGHYRSGSYGGGPGHYRHGSYGGGGGNQHYRYGSYAGTPPFSPPIPPPIPYADPPPAPPGPPVAGGGGQPPRGSGGGGGGGRQASRGPMQQFGTPQPGQTNYVPNQVICVLRDDLTEAEIDQFLRERGMRRTGQGGDVRIGLLGVRVFRFQITDGTPVPAKMAQLAGDPRGVSVQPNIIYELTEMPMRVAQVAPMVRTASGLARPGSSYSMQYVIAKLNLRRAHERAKGERILVAVIDSGVDLEHPELAGTIVSAIDVTEGRDRKPHTHGTAMTGAIVAQASLMGVAPLARVISIRAFVARTGDSASGTTIHVARAIDRAAQEGARIINMSLAGGHDAMVQKAIEEAYARGIVIVAAAGNNGPSAPAAYPAAYPQVIAVTATDHNDRVYTGANRGRYIAVAAPGVDILVVAPGGAVGMTTGTSVAAAHISGIVALMLSRNPTLDPDAVRALLIRSVRAVMAGSPDEYGAGLADAYEAIAAVEPQAPSVPVAGGPPTQ